MPLKDVLTQDNPFGPIDQVRIDDPQDAVQVLDLHEPLSSAMTGKHTLVYGRKGCGKSAVISMFRGLEYSFARQKLSDVGVKTDDGNRGGNIIIPITTWLTFLDMNISVHRHLLDLANVRSANDIDYDLIPAEAVEVGWLNQLWEQIFREFYDRMQDRRISSAYHVDLSNVIMLFNDDSISRLRGTAEYVASAVFARAKNEVIKYISDRKIRIYILFDSMEKYPISNSTFALSMSGFLRAINTMIMNQDIKVVFTLPEELIPHFRGFSENILKDFERSYPMRWRARDLWRIAAYRYMLFLKTHDRPYYDELSRKYKDLLDNPIVAKKFFATFFPEYITNTVGVREESRAYILRHTHLLPRHLILLMNEIARRSFEEAKGRSQFSEQAIVEGVRKRETDIADQVLQPYKTIYMDLEKELKWGFSDLSPIFSFGELQKTLNRFSGKLQMDYGEVVNLLFSIGVIGRISADQTSTIYTEADFSYTFDGSISFSGSDSLCFHPIFSRLFNAERHRHGDQRVIYPRGVFPDVLRDYQC